MGEKHTSGPWDFGPGYSPGDTTFDLFGPGGRQVIAKASYENMWLSTYDEETDAANARLIAAAPDLLEALIEMEREKSDYMTRNNLGDPAEQHTNKMARAAIAKATGDPDAQ